MDKKKMNLTFESENLAVPEIHTNETENETDKTDEETSVIYDNVAIPEIHFRKKKNSKTKETDK